ncbi:unnamed protein product, partial [Meganyctiphanes norvegica]
AMNAWYIRLARTEACDFTTFIQFSVAPFITKLPMVVTDEYVLFRIFPWQVWLTLVGSLVCVSLVLWIIWELPTSDNQQPFCDLSKLTMAFSNIFKAITLQSSSHQPSSS